MKKVGVVASATIWAGAAVSIAEIEAGCRVGANWLALVLGHLLGGALLFAVGFVGARLRLNAMESTRSAFGGLGMRLFASLNVLQLVGWTAVMLAQGAAAVGLLTGLQPALCCLPLAALVLAWAHFGHGGLSRSAMIGLGLLVALCAYLTRSLALARPVSPPPVALGFWQAFEIAAALPLSWLPLVADYTKDATRPVAVTAAAALAYTVVSLWMFALGALLVRAGDTGLVQGIQQLRLPLLGLAIVTLSTMVTTCLDVVSSGESAHAIWPRLRPRPVGLAVAAAGCALAAGGVMDRYLGFLELVASAFAPMAVVLLVDRLSGRCGRVGWNLLAWLTGFAVSLAGSASPVGPTLTGMAAAAFVAWLGGLWKWKRSPWRDGRANAVAADLTATIGGNL